MAFASLPVVANAGMVTVQQDVVTEKIEGYVLKGVVYDDCKQPLADVVVSSGGRTSRTDVNGKFELKATFFVLFFIRGIDSLFVELIPHSWN